MRLLKEKRMSKKSRRTWYISACPRTQGGPFTSPCTRFKSTYSGEDLKMEEATSWLTHLIPRPFLISEQWLATSESCRVCVMIDIWMLSIPIGFTASDSYLGLGMSWECPGNILGVSWEYPGSVLGISWECPGSILGMSWEVSWEYPGSVLGMSWKVSWECPGNILGVSWECPGSVLGDVLGMRLPPSTC